MAPANGRGPVTASVIYRADQICFNDWSTHALALATNLNIPSNTPRNTAHSLAQSTETGVTASDSTSRRRIESEIQATARARRAPQSTTTSNDMETSEETLRAAIIARGLSSVGRVKKRRGGVRD